MSDDPRKKPRRSAEGWYRLKQAALDLADADSEDDAAYEAAVQRVKAAGRAYYCRCSAAPRDEPST